MSMGSTHGGAVGGERLGGYRPVRPTPALHGPIRL